MNLSLLTVWTLIISLIGLTPIALIFLLLEARPIYDSEKQIEENNINYTSGEEKIIYKTKLKRGRIPLLNRYPITNPKILEIPSDVRRFIIYENMQDEERELNKEEQKRVNKRDGSEIKVSKIFIKKQEETVFRVETYLNKSQKEIKAKVSENRNPEKREGYTIEAITLDNQWSVKINDYEITFGIPKIKEFNIDSITHEGDELPLPRKDDIVFISEVSQDKWEKEGFDTSNFKIICYYDLLPGKTRITCRYKCVADIH